MNLGQALGELQLRIHELEEGAPAAKPGRTAIDDAVNRRLSTELGQTCADLDRAKASETAALIRLGKEREARVQAEAKLTSAFERIAKLEAKPSSIRGDDAALKAVNADLEARLRIQDQKLADAIALANKRQHEIDDLLKQPAKIVEVPTPADCSVCKAIKLMVLGVEPRPSSHLPRTVVVHATSLRSRMQEALERAAAPLTAEEIGNSADISAAKVETNIWHIVREGKVVRLGSPGGHGRKAGRYRYWLASRPMPQEAQS